MRKITKEAKEAWDSFRNFTKSNTKVRINAHGVRALYLFGHLIAQDKINGNGHRVGNTVLWTMCGYNTMTTRERLNGILGLCIVTRQGVPYIHTKVPETDNLLLPINAHKFYETEGK